MGGWVGGWVGQCQQLPPNTKLRLGKKHNLPVYVSVIVFGLLKCVSNVALSHPQSMTHQAGDQIPVAVVADDEVGGAAVAGCVQLIPHCLGRVCREPLQVWPNLKPTSTILPGMAKPQTYKHNPPGYGQPSNLHAQSFQVWPNLKPTSTIFLGMAKPQAYKHKPSGYGQTSNLQQ